MRELSASVLDGISISRTPSFDCPSGICTWSEYQSFGICSSCKDVSKQAKRNCHSADQNGFDTFFCDYLIGEDISIGRKVTFLGDIVTGTLLNITMVEKNSSINVVEVRPLIIRLGILRVEADEYIRKREHLEAYEDVRESLYECELSWCLKEYGPAKVDNGILKESAPTQSPFHNKTDVFNSLTRACVDDDVPVLSEYPFYKVFRLQDDVDYSNDTNQYRRLADAFRECPDIVALSEDENVYVVNLEDEGGLK